MSLLNGFECTDKGSYFMCRVGAGSWLLYIEHGSDTVIKLCGRADCTHTDSDCNAYFAHGINICYYDGYLYTYGGDGSHKGLIRLNLDGTERRMVYTLYSFENEAFMQKNKYTGLSSMKILNGVFVFNLQKLDYNGNEILHRYYYMLDGTMEEPKMSNNAVGIHSDGEAVISIGYDYDKKQHVYRTWDMIADTTVTLFESPELRFLGYIGVDAEYFMDDGIVYEYSYAEGKKALFDTGLNDGEYQLSCFPDCIAISELGAAEDMTNEKIIEERTLYFYDWSFNNLGSVNIDFPSTFTISTPICGETDERIMLTDANDLVPRYYINKSDFGTGNIEIHAYKLPDFE